MKLRTIFMGSPDFAVESLRALAGSPDVELLGVVTQPDRPKGRGQRLQSPPVKDSAVSLGLPVWQPERVSAPDAVAFLTSLAPDLLIVVAYGQKIPSALLNLPSRGCINVHGSLLPEYRGAAPIHRAVLDGRHQTGVTTMYMDEGWDTGDMILKRALDVGEEENVGSLHDRMALAGGELLAETVALVSRGTAPRVKQDDSRATYAPKLKPEDSWIDWSRPAGAILNHIRGMNPWPVASTTWREGVLRVWTAKRYDSGEEGNSSPGTIVKTVKGSGFTVQTGDGCLMITEVQPAGRNRMPADAFVNGYGLGEGDELEKPSAC